jgi:uncharacterized protein YndB with AHSA1/START domain
MKIALGVLAALLLAALTIYWVGRQLPVRHSASQQMMFRLAPEQVWAVIADFPTYAEWRKSIIAVERLPDLNGHSVWKEVEKGGGGLQYETLAASPGKQLVRRIAGDDLPFGGTWTFTLAPHEKGTQLTITEDGEIYNPVFRFVARYLMGYQKSMQTYFSDLQARLGPAEICAS